jgi:quercetin 2,3-dioxygenase
LKQISHTPEFRSSLRPVVAGEDLFGKRQGLGISSIAFKVVPQDRQDCLVLENTFDKKGGPARHLHHSQDEWFYVLEGEFIFEVDQERFRLNSGDSFLAPRGVPHVWAYVGDTVGRILIAFLPAGDMEAFFRKVTRENSMPPQDPELWRTHGMELLGPPLTVE